MKKLICVLLSAVLLLASLTVVIGAEEVPSENTPVVTPPTPTGTINDNLVAYWNFEGATAEEQLLDKAVFGEKEDNMVIKGDAVTIADGVAYVPKTANNALAAPQSVDLNHIQSMTLYAKLKYEGQVGSWADIFYYVDVYRLYTWSYDAVEGDSFFRANSGPAHLVTANAAKPDTWFYLAASYNLNVEEKVMYLVTYISADGINWESNALEKELTDDNISALTGAVAKLGKELYLGKSSRMLDCGVSYYFDDARVYNTVLEADDLALIQPNTLELRDPTDLPVEDDESSDEITTPEKVTIKKPAATETTAPAEESSEVTTESVATDADNAEEAGCFAGAGASIFGLLAIIGGASLSMKKRNG